MKMKLLPKFILSLGAMGAVLTVTISFFSYETSKKSLEEMYAKQVTVGSESIATMLSVDDVRDIIGENGDETEAYRETEALFNQLK